ncbi:MAG: LPS export ABC transporter periplasmic protein LptC [Planctomycetota bacterium]
MGHGPRDLLLVAVLAWAGCGRDPGPDPAAAAAVPVSQATEFTWTRSRRDTAAGTLVTAWRLTGLAVTEATPEPGRTEVAMTAPRIVYHPEPGRPGTVCIQAPAGTFNEAEGRITFERAALLEARPGAAEPATTLSTGDMVYWSERQVIVSAAPFVLVHANAALTGTGFTYDLATGRADLAAGTVLRLRHALARTALSGPLPPAPDDIGAVCDELDRMAAAAIDAEYEMRNTGPTILDPGQGVIDLAGPVTFTTTRFTVTAGTMRISRGAVHPLLRGSGPAFTAVNAAGAVRFTELTGAKRTVQCGRLSYDLIAAEAVMTGDPVLTSATETIRSARITYQPDRARFAFAKPYRIETRPGGPLP